MKQVTASPEFKAVGELLTPQCPSLTIEGNSWHNDALITQIECYGAVVDIQPYSLPDGFERRQVNTLALGSIGLGPQQIAEATRTPKSAVMADMYACKRAMFPGPDINTRSFAQCVEAFVMHGVLDINSHPPYSYEFPPTYHRCHSSTGQKGLH